MKRLQSLSRRAVALATAASLTGCASTTTIRTRPDGATLYVDNKRLCDTPCKYTDRKTSFSQVKVRLEKEGYEPFDTVIARDSDIVFSALMFGGFLVPLLYVVGYKPQYDYVLKPKTDADALDWEKDVEAEDPDDLY